MILINIVANYFQIYVTRRQGWRPDGIVLYNKLYNRVVTSRKEYNQLFDQGFTMYVETIEQLNKLKQKVNKKQHVPYAYNDLC